MKNFLTTLVYFVLAIVLLSSIGIWVPAGIDYFSDHLLSKANEESLPSNIVTYALGIFTVAVVDRARWLIKAANEYSFRELEFLLLLIVVLIGIWLTYYSLHYAHLKNFDSATHYALYTTVVAYALWWLANFKREGSPEAALGGAIKS